MSDLTDRIRDGVGPEDSEIANLIDAIDHAHVLTTRTNWGITVEHCLFDDEPWPCWHHRQIHPEVEA